MLYEIRIGLETFDLNKNGEIQRMFKYCEDMYGVKGEKWEEIMNEYDYESLSELLHDLGVPYEEFID